MDPIQQAQLLVAQGQTIPADLQRQVFQQAAANNMSSAQLEQLFNMPAGTAAQAAQQLGIANQIPQQLGGIPRDNFGNDLNSGAAEATQAGMDAFAAQGAAPTTVQPPSTPQYTQAQIDSVVNALNTGQTTPEQVAQQYGGQVPQEEQVKLQELLESKVAETITEMTEKMIEEEQEILSSQGEDPLISLKQQEIQLRAADLQRKSQLDQANLEMDAAKLEQNEKLTKEKIESQEDIAQLRANVNLSKQKQ